MQKLSVEQLYRHTQLDHQTFCNREPVTTQEDKDLATLEFMRRFHPRAYQSLNFGLHLKRNQNHIFIMGESGVGRIGMTKAMLRQAAKQKPMVKDVLLVSDFSESNKTQYLYLTAGEGFKFKKSIEELITQLKTQLPVLFDGHVYQQQTQVLENQLAEQQQEILKLALELAESLSIDVTQSENSFVLSAQIEGKNYRTSELKQFDKEVQDHFSDAFNQVEEALNEALSHFPFLQHEFLDAGKKMNTMVANEYISPMITKLAENYSDD